MDNSDVCMEKSSGPVLDNSDQSISPFVIINCVATSYVGGLIDLNYVASRIPACKFNVKVFAALEIKLKSPKCTALIFGSGKFVVSGCESVSSSRYALELYVKMMRSIGIRVNVVNIKIQNIVSTTNVGRTLSLPKIWSLYQLRVAYKPDVFPGLRLNTPGTKMVLSIFSSGKVVLTGAKGVRDLEYGHELISSVIKCYNENSHINIEDLECLFKVKSKQIQPRKKRKRSEDEKI